MQDVRTGGVPTSIEINVGIKARPSPKYLTFTLGSLKGDYDVPAHGPSADDIRDAAIRAREILADMDRMYLQVIERVDALKASPDSAYSQEVS